MKFICKLFHPESKYFARISDEKYLQKYHKIDKMYHNNREIKIFNFDYKMQAKIGYVLQFGPL